MLKLVKKPDHKLVIFLLCGALLPHYAVGQTAQAGISGTVQDPSGRSIPEASVEAQQQETGWDRKTQTNAAGTYSITGLPIGTYRIRVSRPGFGTLESTGIPLLVGQERTLNFRLSLTAQAVKVEVTSSIS
jgi:hypothetical protein